MDARRTRRSTSLHERHHLRRDAILGVRTQEKRTNDYSKGELRLASIMNPQKPNSRLIPVIALIIVLLITIVPANTSKAQSVPLQITCQSDHIDIVGTEKNGQQFQLLSHTFGELVSAGPDGVAHFDAAASTTIAQINDQGKITITWKVIESAGQLSTYTATIQCGYKPPAEPGVSGALST